MGLRIIFYFILLFSGIASANEQALYLRRVSFLLRGVGPENTDLKKASSLQRKEYLTFLEQKINSYMLSDYFSEKMRIRILELLEMKITPHLGSELFSNRSFFQDDTETFVGQSNHNTVLDLFLLDVIRKNKSWNELLTGNTYQVSEFENNAQEELDFYQDIFDLSNIQKTNGIYFLNGSKAPASKSLAGVLTTPRFFSRNFSSKRNENRKKAATIFKVFLCDAMVPDQVVTEEAKKTLIKKSLNNSGAALSSHFEGLPAMMSERKRHGSEESCMKCHYKLDPLGRAFDLSTIRPSLQQISGRLTFKSKITKQLVDHEFGSISEMADLVTKQPEFKSCQVKHFWNWFIGQDVMLDNLTQENLEKHFELLQRRPKDFIKYLLVSNFDLYVKSKVEKNTEASFENKFRRSLQNFDFYISLKEQFKLSNSFFSMCNVSNIDIANMGLLDPASGGRYPPLPTLSFYQTLAKCSRQMTRIDKPMLKVRHNKTFWNNSGEDTKKQFIYNLTENVLGVNVYPPETLTKITETLYPLVEKNIKNTKNSNNLVYIINLITSYIVLTEEYLFI